MRTEIPTAAFPQANPVGKHAQTLTLERAKEQEQEQQPAVTNMMTNAMGTLFGVKEKKEKKSKPFGYVSRLTKVLTRIGTDDTSDSEKKQQKKKRRCQ